MDETIDDVLSAVTDETTVGDSLVALTADIKRRLDDALSGVTVPPAVKAKIEQVFAQVAANKQKWADAIVANTPAA